MRIRNLGIAFTIATAAIVPSAALLPQMSATSAAVGGQSAAAARPGTASDTVSAAQHTVTIPRTGNTSSGVGAEPPSGYHSHYANVNGFRMHYLRGGHGSPVVLIHGFPQTWTEWRPQMKELAQKHDVIAVDLRGTGDSGVPKKGYDTAQLAEDVHALLTNLGLNKRIQIVAHDIGLWVAYPYAAKWPTEVSRMAVMEGPIPDKRIYSYPALNPGGAPSIWHFGFFQEPLSEQLIAHHEKNLVEGFITQFLAVRDAFKPADFAFYAEYLREPGRLKAWLKMYRALDTDVAQNKKFQARGPLPMPILAIGGEKSLGASIGQQWKEYASHVDAKVLLGSGHWVTEEQPRELTSMLANFLQ